MVSGFDQMKSGRIQHPMKRGQHGLRSRDENDLDLFEELLEGQCSYRTERSDSRDHEGPCRPR